MVTEPDAGELPAGDPYRVLGVRPGASLAEVGRAFRRLARARHPDVAGPGSAEEYRRIRAAYEHLTRRADAAKMDAQRLDDAGRAATAPPGRRIPVRVRSASPRRGRDITARVNLSLAELITGTTRTLVLDPDGGPNGEVTVRIPPGTTPGSRLRTSGQGALGRHGGPPGDLVITVDLTTGASGASRFTVDGRDLHTRLPISFAQAVLGADVPLTVPGRGQVHISVAPGTVPGATVRVPGAGLPATDRHAAGDLLAETVLHMPTDLTPEARRLIADLDRLIPPPAGPTP